MKTTKLDTGLNDLLEFRHGSEGTHWACIVKMQRPEATCCACDPHEDCKHTREALTDSHKEDK